MSLIPQAAPEAIASLASGWTVVTATQRAARTLRHGYNRAQQQAGGKAWAPPAVFAWDSWLASLWRRLVLDGKGTALLLNPHQEHALWLEVLRSDEAMASSLRPLDSLADLAHDAWKLLNRFAARADLARYADSADTRAFATWVTEFERLCARRNFLSPARLPQVLAEAFSRGDLKDAVKGLVLLGFDRKSPDQERLLASIERNAIPLREFAPDPRPSDLRAVVAASNEQTELESCARWVRQSLASKTAASVAVVVPALNEMRTRIDRTFREILAPELEDISMGTSPAPYEFSLGVPLSSTSLVAAALDLLEWATKPLGSERVSRLLLSPYVAGGTEYMERAELDAFTLRRETPLVPELSPAEVRRLAFRASQRTPVPVLLEHLSKAIELLDRSKVAAAVRTHAAWCAFFEQLLQAWGWHAGQPDTSLEFQTRDRWSDALDALATLDFDGRSVSYEQALSELRRICEATLFAPESHDAPVQVIGPLEMAGSQFDAVWFLRAGDLGWPAPVSLHPLLPAALQRERGMPGADPAEEIEGARTIAAGIANLAGTAVFSYARETPDTHQRPSPALSGLDLRSLEMIDLLPAAPARVPLQLQELPDSQPIAQLPDRVVTGGSQILKTQAACGFRSFAENRLFSAGLDTAAPGLDAMERGELVHTILEDLWAELKTQRALNSKTAGERRELLSAAIARALQPHLTHANGWSAAYLEVERERLSRLLDRWLIKELERPEFEVLTHEEQVEDFAVGPLRLQVRPDRIDLLVKIGKPAGEIVLDYKTGYVTPADWKGDRPEEPQVPLYALARNPESLAGVAFARVRPGKQMGLAGHQRETNVLFSASKQSTVSMLDQITEWRGVLTRLAEAFAEGQAVPAPKQYPSTCRYCEQRVLCRLDPRKLEPENLEDLADPEWGDMEAEIA